MISNRKLVHLGQYLHGNAIGVTGVRRSAAAARREEKPGRTARRGLG